MLQHIVLFSTLALLKQRQGKGYIFCSAVNITDTFPRWEINERVYDVTHLPSGFVATGLSLQIIFEGTLNACCFFDILTNTGVVREYSNWVIVAWETCGKLE